MNSACKARTASPPPRRPAFDDEIVPMTTVKAIQNKETGAILHEVTSPRTRGCEPTRTGQSLKTVIEGGITAGNARNCPTAPPPRW